MRECVQHRNMIGGKVVQVSWDQLITMADPDIRERLADIAVAETVHGLVAFRVEQMDSSQAGHMTFMIYGPGCTYKTLEEATAGRLGDAPSRFAYPFAYWSKS